MALGEFDLVLECLDIDLPLLADLVADLAPGKPLDLVLLLNPEALLLADGESLDLLLAHGSTSFDLLQTCLGDLGLLLPLAGPLDILLAGGEGVLALLALSPDFSLDCLPDCLLDLDPLLLSLTTALSRPQS